MKVTFSFFPAYSMEEGIAMTYSNIKEMNIGMGGEVAGFIEKWSGTTIRCFGVCFKNRVMNSFKGYPHDSGLSDATGNKWWVYFECPKCRYGHSFNKMNFFLGRTEIEIRAESERKEQEDLQ